MRRHAAIPLVLLALALAPPAIGDAGGEKGAEKSAEKTYKCPHTTQECLDMMVAEYKSRGWVGILLDMDQATGRLVVQKVLPDSPAKKAGLMEGDVLTSVNGVKYADKNDEALRKVKTEMKPGNTLTYTVLRSGSEITLKVTLAAWPEEVMAQQIGQHMLDHAKAPAP